MERKNKPSSYIEPMPRAKFLQLMREFKALAYYREELKLLKGDDDV